MAVSFGELPHKKKKDLQTNRLFGLALLTCIGFSLFVFCFISYFQRAQGFGRADASLRASSGRGFMLRSNLTDSFEIDYEARGRANQLHPKRILKQALVPNDRYSVKEARVTGLGAVGGTNSGNTTETSHGYGGEKTLKAYGARFAKAKAAFQAHDLITAKNITDQLKVDFPGNGDVEELDRSIERVYSQQNQTLVMLSLARANELIGSRHIDLSLKLSAAKNNDDSDKSINFLNQLPQLPQKIPTEPVTDARVKSKHDDRFAAQIAEADQKSHSPAHFSQAEAIYRLLLRSAPKNGELWRKLAAVQSFQNKFAIAEQSYRHALSIKPEDFDARLGLANLYIWRNKIKDADILLRSLRREFPDNPDIMLAEAQMLRNVGDYKAAVAMLSRIIVLSPNNAEAWFMLGDCQRALFNDLAARDAYQQAFRIDPTNPNIFDRLNADIRKRWRLDLNGGFSSLTNPYSNWGEGGVGLSYRIDEKNTLTGRLTILRHFDETDRKLEIGLIRELVPKTWSVIRIGWTPGAKISSHYEIEGSLSAIVREGDDIVGPLTMTLRGKTASYANGKVHTIFLGARQAFFHDQFAVTGIWVNTFNQRNDYNSGYIARIDGALFKALRAYIGYSDMLEASNGELMATKAVFSGLSVGINVNSQLGLNWAREHRYEAFDRSLYDIALVRKF